MSRPAEASNSAASVAGRRGPAAASGEAVRPRPPFRFERRWAVVLACVFAVSLGVRLYGALTIGVDLDGPGTFRIINYDEGNSCEGALGYLPYPRFLGLQIVPLATLLGYPPPAHTMPRPAAGTREYQAEAMRAKAYCESRPLVMIQRIYSAVSGALAVVLLGAIALMMFPERPQIAWTACVLLGLSNLHIGESHSATTDAPQLFFIVLFTATVLYAAVSKRRWPLILSLLLLVFAVWVKYYVFAVLAYACVLPSLQLRRHWRTYLAGAAAAAVVLVLLVGWHHIFETVWARRYLLWGSEKSLFGTGYGHIGTWRRWVRNAVDLVSVHVVGIGFPAFAFACYGLSRAVHDRERRSLWLAQLPAAAYLVYMLVLGPVTYYRHYLPLFLPVTLLAAYGFWESGWARNRALLAIFLLYPLLLTADSELNYRNDPRRQLRQWYQEHPGARVLASYYVVPPAGSSTALFDMAAYLRYGMRYLGRADYLILSENWYDTSFANELNGPIAWNPEWLIKTTAAYATEYRRILSNQDPNLEPAGEIDIRHFTPEFLIHRYFYGTFQLFIGDIRIFRIRPSPGAG